MWCIRMLTLFSHFFPHASIAAHILQLELDSIDSPTVMTDMFALDIDVLHFGLAQLLNKTVQVLLV